MDATLQAIVARAEAGHATLGLFLALTSGHVVTGVPSPHEQLEQLASPAILEQVGLQAVPVVGGRFNPRDPHERRQAAVSQWHQANHEVFEDLLRAPGPGYLTVTEAQVCTSMGTYYCPAVRVAIDEIAAWWPVATDDPSL